MSLQEALQKLITENKIKINIPSENYFYKFAVCYKAVKIDS
jgi:hypothetical protein